MLMCVMDKYHKKSMCGKWIYIYMSIEVKRIHIKCYVHLKWMRVKSGKIENSSSLHILGTELGFKDF